MIRSVRAMVPDFLACLILLPPMFGISMALSISPYFKKMTFSKIQRSHGLNFKTVGVGPWKITILRQSEKGF